MKQLNSLKDKTKNLFWENSYTNMELLLLVLLAISTTSSIVISYNNFINTNYQVSFIVGILSLIYPILLIYLASSRNLNKTPRLYLFLNGVLILFSYFFIPNNFTGLIWLNSIPIIAFIFFEKTKALNYSLIFLIVFSMFVVLVYLELLPFEDYQSSALMSFFNYLMITGFAYTFVAIFDSTKEDLEKKIEALGELSANLHTEIDKESEMQQKLTNINHFIKNILNNTPNLISVTDKNGKIILSNKKFKKTYGKDNYKDNDFKTILENVNSQSFQYDKEVFKTKLPIMFEESIEIDSKNVHFLTHKFPLINRSDKVYSVVTMSTDITNQKEFETETTRQRDLLEQYADDLVIFKLAVANAHNHIIITDPDGIVIYANKAVKENTGYSTHEVIGKKSNIWGNQMPKEFYEHLWDEIKNKKKTFNGEVINKRKNGEKYIAEMSISPIYSDSGDVKYFIGIERDISKESEIDSMKAEFTTLISHQLRTPLTGIRWNTELMLDEVNTPNSNEQKGMIRSIQRSSDKLIGMVNTLVNISKLESGKIKVIPENKSYLELVENVLQEVELDIKDRNLTLEKALPENIPSFEFDYNLIKLVLTSIINNAIKYNIQNGMINVAVYTEKDNIVTMIRDTGTGIPSSSQNQIFSKFFRAENALKKVTDGSGLSLSLVKTIINSSNGKIWFESKENVGSAFWFSLPMKN